MIRPSRRVVAAVARAIAEGARETLNAQANAVLDAVEPYIEARVHEAIQGERMAIGVTIATRERSACNECLGRAVAACQEVARDRYGTKEKAYGAQACVAAVRALLPLEGV